MINRLSHSQCSKYQLCPQAYDYHYNKRVRSIYHSAALSFGSALDEAINYLLLKKGQAKETFLNKFTEGEINGKKTLLAKHPRLVYAQADFDVDLLSEDDITALDKDRDTVAEKMLTLKSKKSISGLTSLTTEELTYFNYAHWMCLRNKGLMMIDTYEKEVLPKFKTIHAVQKATTLKNVEGDSIIGYIDVIADVEGYGTVILDNKTSSMMYEEDAVLTSPQLSLYVHMEGDVYKTRKAGYIVMLKNIIKNKRKKCSVCGNDGTGRQHKTCDAIIDGKRCHGKWNETISPKVHIQWVIDEIPKMTEDIVIENFDNVNQAIKNGVYTKNFNSCKNHFGGPCPYIKLCFKGKMDGLEKV